MTRAPRSIALVAAAALISAVTSPGCSMMMREPVAREQQPRHIEPDCTDGRSLPTLDLVGAGAAFFSGLLLLALLQIGSEGKDDDDAYLWVAGVFGGSTVLLGTSSATGYATARRCRAAIQDFYARRAQIQFAPPAYQLPPEAPGAERGSCRPIGPTCDPGLVCASRFCVRPPGAAPVGPHL